MSKSQVVSMRFTPDEMRTVREAAQAEHSTVSEYIRGHASRAALLARPGARLLRTQAGADLAFWTNAPELAAVS